ncbi:hypothetical protein BJ878DRAFT_477276 [Calycina marina]|uniref:DUF6594 domain-containing protein n=1 Tax=Calycina marina TaxID=1763456 RepID=A0A9P8CJH9_9HELO|nr:hypothetical protein BJ878DRAFT_477276 [Calycina marina]
MDTSPDLGIFWRFGVLNNLDLLYAQAELVSLERDFFQQREADNSSDCKTTAAYCRSMDTPRQSEGRGGRVQRDMLLRIQGKLKTCKEELTNQIVVRTHTGPGSADVRVMGEQLTRLRCRHSEMLANHIGGLCPVSAAYSPITALRIDRGNVYKIEKPFQYLWHVGSVTFDNFTGIGGKRRNQSTFSNLSFGNTPSQPKNNILLSERDTEHSAASHSAANFETPLSTLRLQTSEESQFPDDAHAVDVDHGSPAAEKRFEAELSQLHRNYGADFKAALLSAVFVTLPLLVLYYIHSLSKR